MSQGREQRTEGRHDADDFEELAFYRALCETFPDGLLVTDGEGRIHHVNERLEEMSGYGRAELLGYPVEILVPEGSRERHACEHQRFVATAQVRHMGTGLPIWLLRKDGTKVPVDVALAPLTTPGGSLTVAAVREDTARRRAEDLLRQSEARYRLLVERNPGITHVSRLDATSSTLYISPQVEGILGYAPAEWEADDELWVKLLHPEDRDLALAANQRLITDGEPVSLDYRMIARDGRVVWIHEETDVVRDEEGRPLFAQGVLLDVTEAKRADEAQRTHLRQLAAIAELSQMAVAGDSLQAVMDRAVELIARILGVPCVGLFEVSDGPGLVLRAGIGWRNDVAGRAVLLGPEALTSLPDRPVPNAELASVPAAGPLVRLLADHGLAGGITVAIRGRRPLGILGAYVGADGALPAPAGDLLGSVAGVLAQAIERDEADRAVRERERRLAEAQAIAHLGSWEWDPRSDRGAWSEEVFRIFGLDPAAGPLTYAEYLRMIHEEDRERVDRAIRAALANGGAYEVDYRIRRSDGTERILLERGRVDAVEAGEAAHVAGTVLDVTELRRTEQELERTVERLRRTDAERRRLIGHLVRAREEERARIAGDIHDDPLQKLAALKLRVGLLRELTGTPQQLDQIEAVDVTIDQVIASLRNLLFELRPHTLDREGLAAALRELLQRTAEERRMTFVVNDAAVDREPPPDARVICYRIAQEAIANVGKHARASHVEVVLASEGGGTRVRIRDDGVGFDPERSVPAPGHLGLPDMRERAELAGGWLRITSAPGSGTVVEFWVPSWAA
jgi:PAS domain S-box-containing protein